MSFLYYPDKLNVNNANLCSDLCINLSICSSSFTGRKSNWLIDIVCMYTYLCCCMFSYKIHVILVSVIRSFLKELFFLSKKNINQNVSYPEWKGKTNFCPKSDNFSGQFYSHYFMFAIAVWSQSFSLFICKRCYSVIHRLSLKLRRLIKTSVKPQNAKPIRGKFPRFWGYYIKTLYF